MKTLLSNLFTLPALIAGLGLLPAGRMTAQTFTTLHSFTWGSDGAFPYAGLITDLSGNTLYGTASQGGIANGGTVFALNTDGTAFTILCVFPETSIVITGCVSNADCPCGGPCYLGGRGPTHCGQTCNYYAQGANPHGGLIVSGNTLYGTVTYGDQHLSSGPYQGPAGTVFKVNSGGGGFTNLHNFTGFSDGAHPFAGLIASSSGHTLYGAVENGPYYGAGMVFAVNTDGTGFANLHSFTGLSDGADPSAGLISSGNTLYGTAAAGGTASGVGGVGTVFAVNTDGSEFTILHNFTPTFTNSLGVSTNSDGANPHAGLILSGNTLYGTALDGGSSGNGTVFAVNTNGTSFTNLYSFTATQTNSSGSYTNSDGAYPYAGLVLSGNVLYGTTAGGGSSGAGTVFALGTNGTGFTTLHTFTALSNNTNSDGAYPRAGLILSGSTLYGTAAGGGSYGAGTVFSLSFRPQLTIALCESNVILSWPTNVAGFDYTGYTLQSTTNLFSPAAWVSDSSTPLVMAGQNTVTNPISGAQKFYRLIR